jgi:nicotinate-nucleotide adenylyltransferase
VRIAFFGGTFDPPHVGHMLAASDAFEGLALDQLVFIPAAQQPLKVGSTVAPAADRARMLELAIGGDARFAMDAVEIARAGLSFTVETLETLAVQGPSDDRFLLLGADVLESFPRWREPRRIAQLARLAILRRVSALATGSGEVPSAAAIVARLRSVIGDDLPAPVVLDTRRVDVSSTEIRDRARAGRSLRGFVADAVGQYIDAHGLYR